MVEFVLVLFPLILFVGGIIQLGIGIANWHDLNRIANEGARFAATDAWPDCAPAELAGTCTLDPPCDAAPAALRRRSLVNYLRCEAEDAGVGLTTDPVICNPEGTGVGEPVTVKLRSHTNFLSLDESDLNVVQWAGVNLRGEATMRTSSPPTKYTAAAGC
jgi:hypothetical protein